MSREDFPFDSDPAEGSVPSVQEQQARLKAIKAKNMQLMVADREFLAKLKEKYVGQDMQGWPRLDLSRHDLGLRVSRAESRRYDPHTDDLLQVHEILGAGFELPNLYSGVIIADRITTPKGRELVAREPFTQENGELVAGMVDELLLAKESGQIPDLDSFDLDSINLTPQQTGY